MPFTFDKAERLKSRKQIGLLFETRKSIGAYPLRIFWTETTPSPDSPVQIGFSVSKKTFKQAVKRNRYKRLMREAHRLNKHTWYPKLISQNKNIHLMLLFVGKEASDFETIQRKYLNIVQKLLLEINC